MSTPSQFTSPSRPLTWLITGCSSGFGLLLTRHAQAAGHLVIATSRNPSRTPELVKEVEDRGGRWLSLDVDDPHRGRELVDELEEAGTHIDVLVNNAGFALLQVIEHFTEDEVRSQMETLYFGPFRLARAVLPHMRKRRFGVVVYISSGSGLEARPALGVYGASKAAADAMTKTLAKEVAPFNIRALYVSLGTFRTNMGNVIATGKMPRDKDYHGSIADKTVGLMASGDFDRGADPVKAVRAIYEVVTGEGIGKGREAETLLPLGQDAVVRVGEVRDKLDHALEVFGDVSRDL